MTGFSQALFEDFGDLLPGSAKEYIDHISLASRKMSDLIDGLLTLSRSTRNMLRYDAVDVSALAANRLSALAQSDPGRKVAWQVEPGLAAQGDGRMIEALLDNLLQNAWKYTGHAATPEIRVYRADMDGRPAICVADNGAGFDMAHAGRLFEPFQRLHRQDEFPGIGIGLATVKRIVHRHGGDIVARGEPGKGAVFCFTLPAPLVAQAAPPLQARSSEPPIGIEREAPADRGRYPDIAASALAGGPAMASPRAFRN
jgi:signal transduction histidine kinase